MPDREKYIEVLSNTAKAVKKFNEDIPIKISLECIEDILELLKEQEAVKPVITPWSVNEDGEVEIAKRECGQCGYQFFTEKPNYCENCGTPILWESGEVG